MGCWFLTKQSKLRNTLVAFLVVHTLSGCSRQTDQESTGQRPSDIAVSEQLPTSASIAAQIETFCGACHAAPVASSFPKEAWHDEVKRGYNFYFKSGRTDLKPPVQSDVVAYYRNLAPDKLVFATEEHTAGSISWKRVPAEWPQVPERSHSISFVSAVDSEGGPRWFVSDMEFGFVACLLLDGTVAWSSESVAGNPAAIRECDLDGNGHTDLVCADLGSYLPGDHALGKVVVVTDYGTPNEMVQVAEAGLGRVADVRVADLNADGMNDIVVAEFGWYETGSVHILYNDGLQDDGNIKFTTEELDDRAGAIQVAVLDLNGDGTDDVAALLAQEHEEIAGYLNRDGKFEKIVLSQAQYPSFGSSGMQFTDFDNDGDQDILYTNGDTFDSYLAKPYHGISLLENIGNLQFHRTPLAHMSGVHRALPADLDNDGDLDIAAVSLLPEKIIAATDETLIPSVVWLEQISPGKFAKHIVESTDPSHATLAITDINQDGRPDLVLGNFHSATSESPLTILIAE